MKAILAELLDLPHFQALTSRPDRLHTRHAGGEGNPLADSASRGKVEALRRLMGQLGYKPFQVAVPADCTAFLNRVLNRLGRAPHVPVPGTCDPAVAGGSALRFWGSDDESPPARFSAQAPTPASITTRRPAESPPAAAGPSSNLRPSRPGARGAIMASLASSNDDHDDERWQPHRWSAAPAVAAPLRARSRTPSPQAFRPAAPAARPGIRAAAALQSAEADSSDAERETPQWLYSQTMLMRPVARALDWTTRDDYAGAKWVFIAEAADAAASIQDSVAVDDG